MRDITSSKLLGSLYSDIVAVSFEIRNDLEILEEALGDSKKKETASNLRLSMEIDLEDRITSKKVDLEELEDASAAIEDILSGRASLKVNLLVDRYFSKIKERYETNPETDRIKVRILKSEIADIEAELEHEGYPIFGGYSSYKALMEEGEEGEQTEFNFDSPSEDEKE